MLFFAPGRVSAQNTSQNDDGWQHQSYAIFFTSHDVQHLLADPADFKKTMDYFAPVKPSRVYIDGVGPDGNVDVPLLKKIAARFREMGIEPDGAMVPTSDRGGTSVYNNQEDLNALKQRMHGLAQVFDRIILDDWLFTTATDPQSVQDRGDRSWAEYRTDLILRQSKKYIIDPAKEVNPDVQVVVKFPNWFESFPENGYDVTRNQNSSTSWLLVSKRGYRKHSISISRFIPATPCNNGNRPPLPQNG